MDQTQVKLDFFFKYRILAPLFSTALSNLHLAASSHHRKAKVHPLCVVENSGDHEGWIILIRPKMDNFKSKSSRRKNIIGNARISLRLTFSFLKPRYLPKISYRVKYGDSCL